MSFRNKWTTVGVSMSVLVVSAMLSGARGAPIPQAPGASASSDTEVSLRGPLHEAFMTPVQLDARSGITVSQEPPEPIDEIPPKVKPKGEDVRWISGYWGWQSDEDDFIWVSGVWRNYPPTQRWVPGYWSEVERGYRWTAGAWLRAGSSRVSYQPPPPDSLERGPSSPQPSQRHHWVPGCWIYRDGEYGWRAGFWARGRAGWVWVPDHYVLTGRGAIFVRGYWDHPLANRGLLFAPVRVRTAARAQARFTPDVTVPTKRVILHLFLHDDYHHYCFGDYYGERGRRAGLVPWHEVARSRRHYDPLLSYYVWSMGRKDVDFVERLAGWHRYFRQKPAVRPPQTLADVETFLDQATDLPHGQQSVLGRTVDELLNTSYAADNLTQLSGAQLGDVLRLATKLRSISTDRIGLESPVSAAGDAAGAVTDRVLDLPSLTEVEGAARQIPDIPGLSPSRTSLPRNVPGLRQGGSSLGDVTRPVRGATRAVEDAVGGLPLP